MYAIQANVSRPAGGGYTTTRQIPTFYLHANVQGIVSEDHARKIAHEIINPFNDPDITVHATAVKL